MTTTTGTLTVEVTREWKTSGGSIYALQLTATDGKRFTVNLGRAWISWADLEVWEDPAKYGLTRYYCPGHNGHVCYYGACDEIRFADTDWLERQGYHVGISSR
jgi:hypothetical protein